MSAADGIIHIPPTLFIVVVVLLTIFSIFSIFGSYIGFIYARNRLFRGVIVLGIAIPLIGFLIGLLVYRLSYRRMQRLLDQKSKTKRNKRLR